MRHDGSYKRSMLTHWGVRELGKPDTTLDEVQATITKMMRKTVEEVQEFARSRPKQEMKRG